MYASVIASHIYVMIYTRPDMTFAPSITSRFLANPGESDWETVKCILKHLQRTKDLFLVH